MADKHVIVRDSDDRVMGVFKEAPDAVAGHTVFFEAYEGGSDWCSAERDVFRDGAEDYRVVDNS